MDLPGPPLICIPTTAGTSADVSQFAIINNIYEKFKIAIISKTVVPDEALIDPATTLTMDPQLTANTGMDALVHAAEALVSGAGNPLTDLHALEAVRPVYNHLPAVLEAPDDLERRSQVMLGSLEAGLALENASPGAVHAMSHSLGGRLDMAHGESNSTLVGHVVRFNWAAAKKRYRRMGAAMGLDRADRPSKEAREALVNAVVAFKRQVGIHQTSKDCGVEPGDVPALARNAINDPCMATNPILPTAAQIEKIYEEAF